MSEELSIREFGAIVWRGRWWLLAITALFVLATGVTATVLPKKYIATVIAVPVSNQEGGGLGGLSSLAAQFGGLASLAGIRSGSDVAKAETVAILQSGVLTMSYVREQNLLPVIFAKKWDAEKKQWKKSERAPTLWLANEEFRKNIRKVTESTRTGLVTINITWTDPVLAAQWANDLVRLTNSYLQEQAIEKAERHIAYLREQALATDLTPVRQAIYSVLESEIKNMMLAKGTDEYALKVVDPAVVPELRSTPRRAVWMIVGGLTGAALSLLMLLLRERGGSRAGA